MGGVWPAGLLASKRARGPRTLGVAFLELVPHDRFAAQTDTAWKPTARSPVRSREGRLIASWPDMRSPTHRIPAKEIRMQSMDLPLRVQYLQRRATSSPSLDAQRSKPPCRQLGSWDAFLRTPHHIPCIGIRKLAFDPSHFGSRIRSLLRPCASCLLISLSIPSLASGPAHPGLSPWIISVRVENRNPPPKS